MPRLPTTLTATVTALLVAVSACGSDAPPSPTKPSTSQPVTTQSSTTQPLTAVSSDGPPQTLVPDQELSDATNQATSFLSALGAGDVERAATYVGPESARRAEAAGGLEALLTQSVEGHGAWSQAVGRSAVGFAVDRGLVAVRLEGTLAVEGANERRVEVFPVRQAEPDGQWMVELWAYDFAAGNPITIDSPPVDDEEQADADPAVPLTLAVRVPAAGSLAVLFDGAPPVTAEADAGEPVTFTAPAAGTSSVVIVYRSGDSVAARGFTAAPGEG